MATVAELQKALTEAPVTAPPAKATGSVLFLGRHMRHETGARRICERLEQAGYTTRHEYIRQNKPYWEIPGYAAEMADLKAVIWWEEHSWLFVGLCHTGRQAVQWCHEHGVLPIAADWGYMPHYKQLMLDVYRPDCTPSIADHWPYLSTVPQWHKGTERMREWRESYQQQYLKAEPMEGLEPGYVLMYLQGGAMQSVLKPPHRNGYTGWIKKAHNAVLKGGLTPVWKYPDVMKDKDMPRGHIGYGRDAGPRHNARLLKYARHAVVISSSVSNESLITGKPVVSCGTGWDYWVPGVFHNATHWRELCQTPEVNADARGKFCNWWIERQINLDDCPQMLEKLLWEHSPQPRKAYFALPVGMGNCIMAVPAMKAIALRRNCIISAGSGKAITNGTRQLLEGQAWTDTVYRSHPATLDVDAVGGAAWKKFQHPNPPEDAKALGYGKTRAPHETVADAVPARNVGYGDILPSTRMTVPPKALDLPPAYVAVAMDCSGTPGTGPRSERDNTRRWPHWRRFAELWTKQHALPLVFIGVRDTDWKPETYGKSLIGQTTEDEARFAVQQADLLISIDNGFSHVAGACGTPTLVLYGPTSSLRYSPQMACCTTVSARNSDCRDCDRTPVWRRCQAAKCMTDIEPERIVELAARVLERGGRPDTESTAHEQVQARWNRAVRHNISPAQELEELIALWPHVEGLRPKRVLEIGSLRGGWLFMMSPLCAEDAQLVMLEPCPNAKRRNARKFIEREGKALTWIRGMSTDADAVERVQSAVDHAPYDLLHIDGDHQYDCVMNDWNRFSPLVRSGGMVVLHDSDPHRNPPDVYRAIQDIRVAGERQVQRWTTFLSTRPTKDRQKRGITIARIR